ncbi:hypothetical protein MSG28_010192 [Choristoneura fumiferana]|uniref:Uncharacterized protein n=2 Tax=Choristoneura fumiferana TaxID=7141 RepID=A0ACC0KJU3_CHOFU|nr:hypothetical protein MSG28_010192 [Choristoneura fumiferana]KAI8436708.1 hypothetical protein MSG28_010192 [Choristoneura fumiferana]
MDGDGDDFNLHWEEDVESKTNEVVIPDTDQIAAENLMYLSQDVVSYTDAAELAVDPSVEVEVPLDHFATAALDNIKEENDIDVPLPTDQDQYTAMRPWPCDFCSRRFRKKAALMNHMVAHQNDRPHACNLCGVRYVRKCDLMNHLKVHAMVPDNADPQWSRRARSPPKPPPTPPSPASEPEPLSPPPPPADPSRPFVCRHCGVGFAREKAHKRHDSSSSTWAEHTCEVCGEACADALQLLAHAERHADRQAPPARLKKMARGRNNTSSNSSRQFPCRECGGPAFCCVVCGRTLHSSAELTGPRKYKRRRKIKSEADSPRHEWERGSASPPRAAPSPPPSPPRRRRRRAPAPRPKLIHTEETVRPRTKQVRGRRPPRHPADDLRAIRLRSPTPSPSPSPEPSPAPSPQSPPAPSPPSSPLTASTTHEGGPFKCEMCALEFPRRDALLLHVPVHI